MLLRPLPTQSEHSHVGNSGWQSGQNGRMLTPRVVEHALDESRSATLMLVFARYGYLAPLRLAENWPRPLEPRENCHSRSTWRIAVP